MLAGSQQADLLFSVCSLLSLTIPFHSLDSNAFLTLVHRHTCCADF